jgi:hypothetical protein
VFEVDSSTRLADDHRRPVARLVRAPGTVVPDGGSMNKTQRKVKKVMGEFKEGTLHSGSKRGPVVKNPKQAVAIALSEARKAGKKRGK